MPNGKHEQEKRAKILPNRPTKRKGSPRREPVAYASLVPIVVTIGAWLGFDLDGETAGAIVGGIVLLAGIVRSQVTPVADPVIDGPDVVDPAAGVKAINEAKGVTE